jgi:hypothetical protein
MQTRKQFNFCYNLEYDLSALIKHLPYYVLEHLSFHEQYECAEYKIKWVPEKCYHIYIKNGSQWRMRTFYDIAQFYQHKSLRTASQLYLNDSKKKFDAAHIDYNRYKYDESYRKQLVAYCEHDAYLCKELAQNIYNHVSTLIKPKYFYSQASISQQYYLEGLKQNFFLPRIEVLQFAMNCYQGGRFETFKRGKFDSVMSYDINSAYPYHAVNVPDVSQGTWQHTNEFIECDVGIYKCKAKIDKTIISPLKYLTHKGLLLYPHGVFEELYLNQNELVLAQELGASIKVLEG